MNPKAYYENETYIIPLNNVSYIEKSIPLPAGEETIWVVMQGSHYDFDHDVWHNAPYLKGTDVEEFMGMWLGLIEANTRGEE